MTPREKAEKLHRKVKTFFITCIGEDGYPLTKAVVPGRHRKSLNELFFATNTSSRFIKAISTNPKGNVYFYVKKLFWNWKGCYLKGNFEIVTDMTIKQKQWDWKYKGAYQEKSYTDPDFCVIRFTPTTGRFYSNFTLNDFEI